MAVLFVVCRDEEIEDRKTGKCSWGNVNTPLPFAFGRIVNR